MKVTTSNILAGVYTLFIITLIAFAIYYKKQSNNDKQPVIKEVVITKEVEVKVPEPVFILEDGTTNSDIIVLLQSISKDIKRIEVMLTEDKVVVPEVEVKPKKSFFRFSRP